VPDPPAIPPHVHDALHRLGFELPGELLDRLARYLDLLLDANTRVNLTGIRDRDEAWRRLIIDSLTVLPWLEGLEEGAAVIDVGTGGGLPGVPLAIARGDLRFTLLDATGKKVDFVARAVETLGLTNATALRGRAEALGHEPAHRAAYDLAISRAIGAMPPLLEWCMPLVKVGGAVLAMKGPKAEAELREAGDALDLLGGGEVEVFDAYPPGFDNDLVIVKAAKDRPTPAAYPRDPGAMKRKPL